MIELIIAPATERSVSKLALFPHFTAGTYNCCYRKVPTITVELFYHVWYCSIQISPCDPLYTLFLCLMVKELIL